MTETDTQVEPVAHTHGDAEHTHEGGDAEHTHDAPAAGQGYSVDPAVQAFCTTITIVVAHTNEVGPYDAVKNVTAALEGLGLRGVVTGVASVELRGDGGLIGL